MGISTEPAGATRTGVEVWIALLAEVGRESSNRTASAVDRALKERLGAIVRAAEAFRGGPRGYILIDAPEAELVPGGTIKLMGTGVQSPRTKVRRGGS